MAPKAQPQPQGASFKYVYIPADSTEELKELELRVPPGKEVECLLDKLKKHFRAAGKTQAAKERQIEALKQQLGDAAGKLDAKMWEAATSMQMVENIALLPNSPETGWVGVNIYCDDEAQAKELPLNPRASQIAECCGKFIEVRGDVFIARIFDNEDEFRRMDFVLSEVSSSAPWVTLAAEIARRKVGQEQGQAMLQRLQQQAQQKHAKKVAPTATVSEISAGEAEKDAGNAAFRKGDLEGAVQRYSKAVELDPRLVSAYNNRAQCFLKLGRLEEAEADCKQVLQLEPRNVKALFRRACAREGLGRRQEATIDLRLCLRLDPRNREASDMLTQLAPPPVPGPEGGSGAPESGATMDVAPTAAAELQAQQAQQAQAGRGDDPAMDTEGDGTKGAEADGAPGSVAVPGSETAAAMQE